MSNDHPTVPLDRDADLHKLIEQLVPDHQLIPTDRLTALTNFVQAFNNLITLDKRGGIQVEANADLFRQMYDAHARLGQAERLDPPLTSDQ